MAKYKEPPMDHSTPGGAHLTPCDGDTVWPHSSHPLFNYEHSDGYGNDWCSGISPVAIRKPIESDTSALGFQPVNMLNGFNHKSTEHRTRPGQAFTDKSGAELAAEQYIASGTPFGPSPKNVILSDALFIKTLADETNRMPEHITDAELAAADEVLLDLVGQYITGIETGLTKDNCMCEWVIHPEDANKPEDKQRKRRAETHMLCPVHTKEGLVIGFIRFLKNKGELR